MTRALLLSLLITAPAYAAHGVVALGVAGRGGYARAPGYYGALYLGPSVEFDLDAPIGPSDRLGLRLRAIGLLPYLVEGHVGLGYRHLFRPGQPVRPFFGITGALVVTNECGGGGCGYFGFAGSGEGGVEIRLGRSFRLWAWAALFGRYAGPPVLVGMPSLWLGFGW
ncbi:MAG: hypothetical protein ACYC8T_35640 [Myxococcaceae bacterium]